MDLRRVYSFLIIGTVLIIIAGNSVSLNWQHLPEAFVRHATLENVARWKTSHGQPDPTPLLERTDLDEAGPLPIVPGYIRPEFAVRMQELRPSILAAAKRHNRPALSGMTDTQFAEVIALVLYNEHDGWLEDDIQALRPITPFYQRLQIDLNESGLGSNFSVWPANLRPSVGLELLHQQLPVPAPTKAISVPVQIFGSKINPRAYASKRQLFAAITAEIRDDDMAIEYLAANLERGLYRAHYDDAPVSWRTLAAWHNQGIVLPQAIQRNATARSYVQRCTLYLQAAHYLIDQDPSSAYARRR